VRLLRPVRRRAPRRRVFVLGLDGMPRRLLLEETRAGRWPHLAALLGEGSISSMRSSLPPVSSTAWTTFFTGQDAGGHGVFGFTDLRDDGHGYVFPNLEHVRSSTIWDLAAKGGKRSFVLNVPGTYPARPLEGVMVSGFVAPSIERAVSPPGELDWLRRSGYRIDLDAWATRGSFDRLEEDLFTTLDRRRAAIHHLLERDDWDLFIAVVTETDRLYHFHWNSFEAGDPRVVDLFRRFHAAVDELVGSIVDALPPGTELVMLSDHGFTTERVDVSTNAWLQERGYLAFEDDEPTDLSSIQPSSTVYSLAPGRFYVNRAGTRPRGSVTPERVPQVLDRLLADLDGLRDPESGELVYGEAVLREDAYRGPETPRAPDLVLSLKPGYELKAPPGRGPVLRPPAEGLAGMHDADGCILYARGRELRPGPHDLHDLAPTIAALLDLDVGGFRGHSVLEGTSMERAG